MAIEPVSLKGQKVLIVDDMPANLDVLSQILEAEEYEVSFATDGEQAIRLATLDQPDLILLDVMMPVMDGFETCRRLKSLDPTRDIPVIFVTGKTDTGAVVEGFHIGAADYISKPICQEEVCARVRAHLQTRELLRIRNDLIDRLRTHNERNRAIMASQHEQLVSSTRLASLGELVGEFAHEVSTPVGNSLTALTHLIQEGKRLERLVVENALTRAEFSDYLGASRESGNLAISNMERAVQLIQGFRQVAVDQCSEQASRFNLKEYLRQVLLTLSPKLKQTAHRVELEGPEDLVIDSYPGAFAGILTNLVNNSLLHGFRDKPRGEIRVVLSREQGGLLIDYRDDGCGIAEENLGRIFEKYFTSNREGGGSGLGLHIIRSLICDVLDGEVECRSHEGDGVCFLIRVPLTAERSSA